MKTYIRPDSVLVFWVFPEWVTHDPTIPPIYIEGIADQLTARTYNGLRRAECRTLEDVARLTRLQAVCIRGLGQTSLREIETLLNAHGLRFATEQTVELPRSCR